MNYISGRRVTMIVVRKDVAKEKGVQKIVIAENGFITIDGVSASPPMTIEVETHVGFFALENLAPMFKHMKCWANNDGEQCAVCPVKHDGVCGMMGIRDAAEKESMEGRN
jgi:hypothetical protein